MAKKHRFLEQLGGDPFVDDDTDVTRKLAMNLPK
jgi:hypothetical protein